MKHGVTRMTDNDQLVSIIMAAYNAEKTINAAVRSVIKQTYQYWELIVINDCSTDSTSEIISSMAAENKRIRIINNEKNRGVSVSRKKGAEAALGQWIAILDSDDLWAEDKLEKQIKYAQKKDAELVFTGSAFIDSDGNAIGWYLHVPPEINYRKLLKQNVVSNSSVLVKKELYLKHYALGDNMHEDFAVWLSITNNGVTAYGIDEPLLIYRVSRSSKSGDKLKAARMNWNTYRYIGLTPFEAAYYMCWYTAKNVLKYRHLK